jgi:hypothetical protein
MLVSETIIRPMRIVQIGCNYSPAFSSRKLGPVSHKHAGKGKKVDRLGNGLGINSGRMGSQRLQSSFELFRIKLSQDRISSGCDSIRVGCIGGCDPLNEKIRSVHGRRLDFGKYGIAGYQFSPPFMGGCHEKPEDEIAEDLCKIELLLDLATILVIHTPAFGYVGRIYSGYQVGSHSLAWMFERVDVACHIHHSFGRAGKHFNVAAGAICRAMITDLPSLSHDVIQATVEQRDGNVK